ncbi:hypothetical protein V7138_16610 [Bacillus sp. JJ1533]|uniref:hypothetical protein n=1 Tax=Bacillus sp. JJ1533 TaxID=3122959 RepID=UPI002FFDD85F
MMKNSLRVLIVLCSVVAAVFLPKKSYITYLPVALFSTSVLLFEIFYFTVHKLWTVKGSVREMVCDALIFILGPYLFANFWVFNLTRGKFVPYTIINLVSDLIFAYPVITLLEKLNYFKIKISSAKLFTLIFSTSLTNFIFYKFYEVFIAPKRLEYDLELSEADFY